MKKKTGKSILPSDAKRWVKTQVNIDTKTGCWLWTGAIAKNPSLRARIAPTYRIKYSMVSTMASRSVFALYRPDKFDPDLQVLHSRKCPPATSYKCVNPDHMYVGTVADNMRDRSEFGNAVAGVDHPLAQLTARTVKRIRRLYDGGMPCATIMRTIGFDYYKNTPDYHLVWMIVYNAATRKTYKNIKDKK